MNSHIILELFFLKPKLVMDFQNSWFETLHLLNAVVFTHVISSASCIDGACCYLRGQCFNLSSFVSRKFCLFFYNIRYFRKAIQKFDLSPLKQFELIYLPSVKRNENINHQSTTFLKREFMETNFVPQPW